MRVLNERKLLLPYLIVFVYMFVPTLITLDEGAEVRASGTSATEIVNGVGGPEGEPFVFESVGFLDMTGNKGFRVVSNYSQEIERQNYLNYSNAVLPVDNPLISSDFGWRSAPCKGCSNNHQGVDFVPGAGEPVKAILNGVVAEAGLIEGYGYWVKLEHIVPVGDDQVERWESVYAHLQQGSIPDGVVVGSNVDRGQLIGLVGSTGVSTGPHLHFELRVDGVVTDPLPIIAQSQVLKNLEISWR
jgi:murein DD-endopeptidase MepM/ murein hydrolase activator NlpD